jgi:hypothetical protein
MNKTIITILLVAAAILIAPHTSHARTYKTLNQGVIGSLAGSEVKWVKVDGHVFHIKPVRIVRTGNKVSASGQISHHLSGRPDDQISYTIVKRGDRIIQASVTGIVRGGLASIFTEEGTDEREAAQAAGRLIDGSWEGACRQIVAALAVSLE